MSIAEVDRRSRRRAALRVALRDGDVVSAARAWERLRVRDAEVAPREIARARAARAVVGRAIRIARWRRTHVPSAEMPGAGVVIPFPQGRLARVRGGVGAAAILFLVLALLIVVFPAQPQPTRESAPPAAAAPEPRAVTEPAATVAGGRGRTTSVTLPPVAQATVAPAEAPSTAPSTPGPTSGPARTAAPSGAPGGVAGGVPGGVVGGTGGATATPASARPAPTATLNILPLTAPPLAVGMDRFLFRVVDGRTRAALANVCVVYGTITCGPNDPHTNTLGYFWLDLVQGVAPTWSFRFFKDPDYLSATVIKTYRSGMGTSLTTVFLRRR